MENNNYLPSTPDAPAPDPRAAWLLRIKRALVATVALALVVLFVMALRGTAQSLHRDLSPADIAARAGCPRGGVPKRAYRLEGGSIHVDCAEVP